MGIRTGKLAKLFRHMFHISFDADQDSPVFDSIDDDAIRKKLFKILGNDLHHGFQHWIMVLVYPIRQPKQHVPCQERWSFQIRTLLSSLLGFITNVDRHIFARDELGWSLRHMRAAGTSEISRHLWQSNWWFHTCHQEVASFRSFALVCKQADGYRLRKLHMACTEDCMFRVVVAVHFPESLELNWQAALPTGQQARYFANQETQPAGHQHIRCRNGFLILYSVNMLPDWYWQG